MTGPGRGRPRGPLVTCQLGAIIDDAMPSSAKRNTLSRDSRVVRPRCALARAWQLQTFVKRHRHRQHQHRQQQRGYSLLEILIVLAIIGLISGITAVALIKFIPEARIKATHQSALAMRSAASIYRMQHADECPSVETLKNAQLIDEASKTTDAWDTPLVLECDERGGIHVSSAGPDKKMNTNDDIRVPEPPTATAAVH
jgi:prepilin-type N-terminal cleavage/methylation domain-containing protein